MLILDRAEAGHRFSLSWEVYFYFSYFILLVNIFWMSPHPSPPFKTMLRDYLNPRRLESRINFTNLQFNRWTRDGDQSQKVLRMTHYTK